MKVTKVKHIWIIWAKLTLKDIRPKSWLFSILISMVVMFVVQETLSFGLKDRIQKVMAPKLEQLFIVDSYINSHNFESEQHAKWFLNKVNNKGIQVNQNAWTSIINIEQITLLSIDNIQAENFAKFDKKITFELTIDSTVRSVSIGYSEKINYLLLAVFVVLFTFPIVAGLELRRLGIIKTRT